MRVCFFACFFLFFCSVTFSAESLTLDQFLSRTLADHPWMKRSAQEYWAAVFQREAAYAIYDWNLFASYTFQKGLQSEGFTSFDSDTDVQLGKIEVARLFPGAVSLAITGVYEGYKTMPAPFPGIQTPDLQVLGLSVTLRKPLWQNLMGTLDVYPIKLQGYREKMAEIRYQDDLNTFVKQLTDVYLSWYLQYRTEAVLTEQMKSAEATLAITLRQANAQLAEPLDVAQSRQQVLSRRVQVKQARQVLAQQEAAILGYMGVKKSVAYKPVLPKIAFGLSEKEALNYVVYASSLSQLLDIQIHTQEALLSYRHELNKPVVNGFLRYNIGSRESYGQLNGLGGKNTVSAGVDMSLLLEDTALAGLDEAHALIRQTTYQKEQSLRQLGDGVRVSFVARKTLANQLKEVDKLVSISKEVAALETQKYQAGRSPSQYFVIGAQERVLDAAFQREMLVVQDLQLQNALAAMTDRYRAYVVFSDRLERP